jgi:hypothetical protein
MSISFSAIDWCLIEMLGYLTRRLDSSFSSSESMLSMSLREFALILLANDLR